MLSSPFPSSVSFVSLSESGSPSQISIHERERALLSPNASPKRVREFVLGRTAARLALEALGISDPPPVLTGSRGEPLWPDEIVGSISHGADLAVCAVARASAYRAVGLDVQSVTKDMRASVSARICRPSELAWCDASSDHPAGRALRIFSAKEALFKLLYPSSKALFFFHDAELEPIGEDGFRATLLKDLNGVFPKGFRVDLGSKTLGERILSYASLPAEVASGQ